MVAWPTRVRQVAVHSVCGLKADCLWEVFHAFLLLLTLSPPILLMLAFRLLLHNCRYLWYAQRSFDL
jgi:hypothetical protein